LLWIRIVPFCPPFSHRPRLLQDFFFFYSVFFFNPFRFFKAPPFVLGDSVVLFHPFLSFLRFLTPLVPFASPLVTCSICLFLFCAIDVTLSLRPCDNGFSKKHPLSCVLLSWGRAALPFLCLAHVLVFFCCVCGRRAFLSRQPLLKAGGLERLHSLESFLPTFC